MVMPSVLYRLILLPSSEYKMDAFDMYKTNLENQNVIKEMFKQKLNRLEKNIEEIQFLIDERKNISENVSKDFDAQVMNTRNEIFKMENISGYNKFNLDSLNHVFRNKITELEVEKVREHVNFWRDLTMLRQKLLDQRNEFELAQNKINLFENMKQK